MQVWVSKKIIRKHCRQQNLKLNNYIKYRGKIEKLRKQ
jgi:hypothetical protein